MYAHILHICDIHFMQISLSRLSVNKSLTEMDWIGCKNDCDWGLNVYLLGGSAEKTGLNIYGCIYIYHSVFIHLRDEKPILYSFPQRAIVVLMTEPSHLKGYKVILVGQLLAAKKIVPYKSECVVYLSWYIFVLKDSTTCGNEFPLVK